MDPRTISSETLATLRAAVAREHGISLYLHYPEAAAATFLQLDLSTVKRNRRAGRVPYVS